jgi:hypothetical protein
MHNREVDKMTHYKTVLSITLLLIFALFSCCPKKKPPSDTDPDEPGALITPDGGEYTFADGLILNVPPGAVDRDTVIDLHFADSLLVKAAAYSRGIEATDILAFVEGLPEQITFAEPVQLTIPVPIEKGVLPVAYGVDLNQSLYTPLETTVTVAQEQQIVTIELSHFSAVTIEKLKEYTGLSEECITNPCQCINFTVTQSDNDIMCSENNCQISKIKLSVKFDECPGEPVEELFIREVSDGCKPKLTLSAVKQVVETGESTDISATLELGCEPQDGKTITFSISDPALAGISASSKSTDSNGAAVITLTAKDEEGAVTVTAQTTVTYRRYVISASAGGMEEVVEGPQFTETLTKSVTILIEDGEIKGTLTFEAESYLDGFHIPFRYSNPLPFYVDENDAIVGGGPLQISAFKIFPHYVIFDFFADAVVNLSGTHRNDSLIFEPPTSQNISGYFYLGVPGEGMFELTFDDNTAEGTVYISGYMLFRATTTTDDDTYREEFVLQFPRVDGEVKETVFNYEDGKTILRITLNLEE